MDPEEADLFCNPAYQSERTKEVTPWPVSEQAGYHYQPNEDSAGNAEYLGLEYFKRVDMLNDVSCPDKCYAGQGGEKQDSDRIAYDKRYLQLAC